MITETPQSLNLTQNLMSHDHRLPESLLLSGSVSASFFKRVLYNKKLRVQNIISSSEQVIFKALKIVENQEDSPWLREWEQLIWGADNLHHSWKQQNASCSLLRKWQQKRKKVIRLVVLENRAAFLEQSD